MDFKAKIIGTFIVEKQAEAYKKLIAKLYEGVECEIFKAEVRHYNQATGERTYQGHHWCVRTPAGVKLRNLDVVNAAFSAGVTWDM
ncbi:MAG: hypothetical protein K2R98_19355 [Gemmataceae bacterium]|nr:hypothetical protein [Gemmataceae bacterium]